MLAGKQKRAATINAGTFLLTKLNACAFPFCSFGQ